MTLYTTGLALSGGGARGIAHIGIIQALEENQIYPGIIAGTSIGSIVGALYAAGMTTNQMLEFASESSLLKIYRPRFTFTGLTDLSYLREKLLEFIPHDSFEQLQRPFYATVCNLHTGQVQFVNSGSLSKAVEASCSIPMVFDPVEINDQHYVDGGLMNNLPVESIRDKAKFIIGVDVMPQVPLQNASFKIAHQVALRCFEMAIWSNSRISRELCDILIEPTGLFNYHIMEFSKVQELYEIGYDAAQDIMPELKAIFR